MRKRTPACPLFAFRVVFVQQVATLPFHVREGEKERGGMEGRRGGVAPV